MAHKPTNHNAVSPYLASAGAAKKIIEFLKATMDAKELMCMTDGKTIFHAELAIGDSVLMLADASDHFKKTTPDVHIIVPNVDETYKKALAEGACDIMAPMVYAQDDAEDRDKRGGVKFADVSFWISTAAETSPKRNNVSPYISMKNANVLIDFCQQVFGGKVTLMSKKDGVIRHAEILIDDSIVMVGQKADAKETPIVIHVYVPNAIEFVDKAAKAGATEIKQPKVNGHGDTDLRGSCVVAGFINVSIGTAEAGYTGWYKAETNGNPNVEPAAKKPAA